jgi:hypothetical protein
MRARERENGEERSTHDERARDTGWVGEERN